VNAVLILGHPSSGSAPRPSAFRPASPSPLAHFRLLLVAVTKNWPPKFWL
jgi:hypothetical protein